MADLQLIAKESKASQGTKELQWLLEQVAPYTPKIILEIGVHRGYSLETWYRAFQPDLLIGIDNDLHDLQWGRSEAWIMDADSHEQKTLALLKEGLSGQQVDFLFIDGDHLYDGVRKDFQMYAPLVRKDGIIAFDDMALFDNPSVEVYKFWDQIKDDYSFSMYHKDSNGIGLIYV